MLPDPTDFQAFLQESFSEFRRKSGRWNTPVSEFARWCGVSSASMDQWIIGTRVPELVNQMRLAKRLGPKVFELLGTTPVIELSDPQLKFIVDAWEVMTDEARNELVTVARQHKQSG